jgi:hypothetical protein
MALTSMQVYIDPPPLNIHGSTLVFDGVVEFSRNERGREIVRAYVIPTPNDPSVAGEEITVRLMRSRRDRNEEVVQAAQTYTFAGAVPPGGVAFEWDLRNVVHSAEKPFPVVRRGDYYVRVEHTGGSTGPSNVTAESEDFRVAIMTTDRLEEEWLLGATRRSNDDRQVKFQPRDLTGIVVKEVSRNHPLDLFYLNLNYHGAPQNFASLSWAGGEDIKIDVGIPTGIARQYLLPNQNRRQYIVVEVDPRIIPNTDTTEALAIDRQFITRESLRRWIDAECQWMEEDFLYVPIEPALIVSDFALNDLSIGSGSGASTYAAPLPVNSDYDIKGPPITYYPPQPGHWMDLKVPYWRILHFDYLIGALENTRIVDVNVDWIHKGSAGYISLVPFNQSLAYHFIGLVYVHQLRGPVELPSFWRYRYWAGIENNTTPLPIVEVIGMRAAVKALAVLGQSFRGGYSSQSVSRDGVSESASYTASATFGIYSATIEEYKKRLEPLEKQLQRRYYGMTLEVL